MKKKMVFVMCILASLMIMAVSSFASSSNQTYYIGTNKATYGYSPIGERIVMGVSGNSTSAITSTLYMAGNGRPEYQYLYSYVAERQYTTVLTMSNHHGSFKVNQRIYSGYIDRHPQVATYNYYHISKCFNYPYYTTSPSVGMVNLIDEYIIRVNQTT